MNIKYFKQDQLQVFIAENRQDMGKIAGHDIAAFLKILLEYKETVNVMFAAAPSQNDVLIELSKDPNIDWSRINGFHMDEYIGLSADAPQGFGNFLREKIFSKKKFKQVFYLNPTAEDPTAEASRYQSLLEEYPMDVCVLGVGENGHLAFNDPKEADFHDGKLVKTVELDDVCREQQVHDGCFSTLADVPKTALTVTIPGLLRASAMFCIVPTKAKAAAINRLLRDEIQEACPSSILRSKTGAKLYLDQDAASLLNG